jgi:hypothetical protein
MEDKACLACSVPILPTNSSVIGSDRFSFMLKEYKLTDICRDCYDKAKGMYKMDLESFNDWLDENDSRSYEDTDIRNTHSSLTRGQGIESTLLEDNSEEYYMNLDAYASRVTDFSVWFANKFEINLKDLIEEYDRDGCKTSPE